MTSRRAFVVAFVTLTTVVAGAVASIRPPADGTGDHGGSRDRRVPATANEPAPQLLPQRYDVTVTGLGARTRATLVFRNDLGRVLDGELVFPLPE